jgi:hypothetical protein
MNTALSPIESEFQTTDEALSYERWFRAKVQKSLDDPRPNIPHDQVMAEMRQLLEDKRKAQDADRVAA